MYENTDLWLTKQKKELCKGILLDSWVTTEFLKWSCRKINHIITRKSKHYTNNQNKRLHLDIGLYSKFLHLCLHATQPGQEGGHFLMIPTQLCVFVMLGHMAIINQLLDIFWTATSSCSHILSTPAVHSIRHCQKCCPATGGWQSCSGKVLTTSYVPLSAYLHHILGCGWTLPNSIAGEQFFFSKIPKAKQKSMSLCWFASIQLTVMLKIKHSNIITIMRLVDITCKNQCLLYLFAYLFCVDWLIL